MVAERRTESELSRGEERKIAEFTKAVKVTTEGMKRPRDFWSRTMNELHNELAKFWSLSLTK